VPTPDLDQLVDSSTLIVRGEVVSFQPGILSSVEFNNGRVDVRSDLGLLRVDEFVKGSAEAPLLPYTFLTPVEPIGWRIPPAGAYGLFFLQVSAGGEVQFADTYYPYAPTMQNVASVGDSPLERAISVLGAALSNASSSDESRRAALTYLQSSKSEYSGDALREALSAPDPQLRLAVASSLLFQGDGAGLGVIKEAFLPGSSEESESSAESIGNAMLLYLTGPEFVPDLEDLLGSPSVHIRRGAAGALRRIGTPEVTRGLLRALDDTDFRVRYYAVVGMAEATGQSAWRPSEETFQDDELTYLTHWRDWASTFRIP
jgi:hypothetical protein